MQGGCLSWWFGWVGICQPNIDGQVLKDFFQRLHDCFHAPLAGLVQEVVRLEELQSLWDIQIATVQQRPANAGAML